MDCYMRASLKGTPVAGLRESDAMPVLRLPPLLRWHVASQDRLLFHLHAIWGGDGPRVGVDLGSHCSHGVDANISDAIMFLDLFRGKHSVVLAVDAFEDFALDLQVRATQAWDNGSVVVEGRQ